MGHVRLGRLPRTRQWIEVVDLLETSPERVGAVAAATTVAAGRRLRELSNDHSLAYCFWVVIRIASASREHDFEHSLADIGVAARHDDTVFSFVARVTEHVQVEFQGHPESGPFAEIASLAMRRALTETVGQEGWSLFGSTLEDLNAAFSRHSMPVRFGALARSFFGDLVSRTLRFFVEREVTNKVGPEYGLESTQAAAHFTNSLDLYVRNSARIMERFGRTWYLKHLGESGGRISREEAQVFVGYALRRIRGELVRAAV